MSGGEIRFLISEAWRVNWRFFTRSLEAKMSQKRPHPQRVRILCGVSIPILWAVFFGCLNTAEAGDLGGTGASLFAHKWVADDPVSPGGDGLGPMYNADSCVACHHQGAIGGAGPGDRNVLLLSLAVPDMPRTPRGKSAIQSNAGKVHPAFTDGPNGAASIILHQFSTEPGYARWRLGVLGQKLPVDAKSGQIAAALAAERKRRGQPSVAELPRKNGVSLRLSQRNTPALFGAGLINSISDTTLLQLEDQQANSPFGVHGRVGRTADGRVGRFGWRGQVADLRDFVLTACSMELGLGNDRHPQAKNPLDLRRRSRGDDLTDEQCDSLVDFVASLPAPRQLWPANQKELQLLEQGTKLFETTGCVACHVENVGDVEDIFSDLLLHDMGPTLEDPVPAAPETSAAETNTSGGSSAYGGSSTSFASIPPRALREWRTPPLWGVRDSAPYLHDGRARTIEEAIALHGGEGASSAKKFADLDYRDRSRLLMFLKSLAAPEIH
jgi:CxxC motif-containing protein (DUF1111 family)